jgi:hypothetical protein
MKKWIKVILGLLFLGVLSIAVYIGILLLSPSTDVIDNTVEYHSKEELSDLYWQNKELLNRVKDSVISNDKVLQALIDEQDGDTGIYLKQDEVYFSQEEWRDVETIFKVFHPTMLMLERKGRPLIFYIGFGSSKQNSVIKSTLLYWFPNDEEREYHEETGVFPDGVFSQLDEGWYIVETTESR